MEHQNQQTGLYSKDVIINFRSSEARHFMLLREALRSFDGKDTDFKLCAMGGHTLNTPRCFKLFSHFLSDIIDSCPPVQEVPTIILPDCPVNSIKHLLNLLTEGFTQSREGDHDVRDIIEVANVLKIDIKNLVYDDQTKQAEPMKVDELEEGEIEDDEEDFLLMEQEQKFGNKIGIKIASFAEVDRSNPNIMTDGKINNNILFPCLECKKNFGTADGLERHLRMSSKHGTVLFHCTECRNSFGSEAALKNHMKTTAKHGNEKFVKKTGIRKLVEAKKRRECRCSICFQVLESKPKLISHMEIHNTCQACGKVFQSISCLDGHIRIAHPHKCNFCEYVGSRMIKLKIHMKKHHGDEMHKICKVCGQVFQSISCLKGHVRIAHPYKCDLCEYVGSQRSKLKNHMKKHHGDYPSEIL